LPIKSRKVISKLSLSKKKGMSLHQSFWFNRFKCIATPRLFGRWNLENCSNFVRKKVVTYPRVDTHVLPTISIQKYRISKPTNYAVLTEPF
jgi:DNA topoisomerase IA